MLDFVPGRGTCNSVQSHSRSRSCWILFLVGGHVTVYRVTLAVGHAGFCSW